MDTGVLWLHGLLMSTMADVLCDRNSSQIEDALELRENISSGLRARGWRVRRGTVAVRRVERQKRDLYMRRGYLESGPKVSGFHCYLGELTHFFHIAGFNNYVIIF